MNKQIAKKWIKALRSGEYKQGQTGRLKSDTGYCCLGVLCEIASKEGLGIFDNNGIFHANGEQKRQSLPSDVLAWSEMKNYMGYFQSDLGEVSLWNMNDGVTNKNQLADNRLSFNEIADVIEEYQEEL